MYPITIVCLLALVSIPLMRSEAFAQSCAYELLELHAPPAVVGRIARDASVGRLIVSHIGLFDLDAAIAELKEFYTGPLTVGADMQCTPVR
jgi:ribonuclease BN (tRNA processing enzyme)